MQRYDGADIRPLTPAQLALAKAYLEDIALGMVCPACHAPLEEKKQVGRCVYGIPCGCRMYQGRLDKKPPKE